LAGYRRSVKSDNPVEDDAIEKVLVLVYSGDTVAMEACSKLDAGSEDKVEDLDNVSYGRIKQLAYELKLEDDPEPEEAAEEATDAVVQETSAPSGTEEVQSDQAQIEQPQPDVVAPQQTMTEVEQSSAVPPTSVTAGDAANDAAKEVNVESPSQDYVVVEKSESQPLGEVQANGHVSSTPEPPKTGESKDAEFTKVPDHRRGRGGRGGYRGRGDGPHRGAHRGRGGHRGEGGERGEYRGRGGHRGPRGDGHRGEGHRGGHRGGRGDKAQQPQQQPQAVST